MNEDGADISAKLEQAIAGDVESVESPTTETGTEEVGTASGGRRDSNTIPYSRFKEVNDSRRELQEHYSDLERSFKEQSDSLARMTQMLESAKEDASLVQEIRALANDPNMLPHIEALDRKLKGIEEEVEETGEASDKSLDKARQLIERQHGELAEELADQKLDIIVQRADSIADKWLDALPEEYDAQDKEVISKLWASSVDLDALAEDPSSLHDVLRETFQQTIDLFGIPRGGLIDPNDPDSYEIEMDETPAPNPTEELLQKIQGKNYGGFKEVEVGGRKVVQQEVSDEEFAADFAKAMRARTD